MCMHAYISECLHICLQLLEAQKNHANLMDHITTLRQLLIKQNKSKSFQKFFLQHDHYFYQDPS